MSSRISLSLPHVDPARHFSTLFLFWTLSLMLLMWGPKFNMLSNVKPRIFGFLMVGMVLLSILMSSSVDTSFDQVVNKVAVDFSVEISSFLSLNHAETVLR